jgi:hypothetical protein
MAYFALLNRESVARENALFGGDLIGPRNHVSRHEVDAQTGTRIAM